MFEDLAKIELAEEVFGTGLPVDLTEDLTVGDFVVVELKRGKTSDTTVGQILRYMAYVKENLAKPGQSVRGVIVAKEVDDALRYAVRGVDNIKVLTYQIGFTLSSIG